MPSLTKITTKNALEHISRCTEKPLCPRLMIRGEIAVSYEHTSSNVFVSAPQFHNEASLGRIKRHGLAGGSVSLGTRFEVSKDSSHFKLALLFLVCDSTVNSQLLFKTTVCLLPLGTPSQTLSL